MLDFGDGINLWAHNLFSCRWQALQVNLNHSYLPRFLYNIDRIEFIELKTFYRWDVRSQLKFSRRLFTFKHLVLLYWNDSTYVFSYFYSELKTLNQYKKIQLTRIVTWKQIWFHHLDSGIPFAVFFFFFIIYCLFILISFIAPTSAGRFNIFN